MMWLFIPSEVFNDNVHWMDRLDVYLLLCRSGEDNMVGFQFLHLVDVVLFVEARCGLTELDPHDFLSEWIPVHRQSSPRILLTPSTISSA